jgi:hypothetical protein
MNKYIPLIIILLLIFVIFKDCNKPVIKPVDNTNIYKQAIKKYLSKKDSLDKLSKPQDSIRIEYITKWRTKIKYIHDSIPCDSALPIIVNHCDSIIYYDSVYINTLKQIIKVDSSIIHNQKSIIFADSVKIDSLSKDIRKHKRHKKLLTGGLILTGAAAIIK